MSKRRRRKKSAPNIPLETLERAREQAGLDLEADDSEAESTSQDTSEAIAESKASNSRSSRRSRRRKLSPAQLDAKKHDPQSLDSDMIAEALENPTKFVTPEQMWADYGYVLKDLRSMGILAAVLFVALVLMAQLL